MIRKLMVICFGVASSAFAILPADAKHKIFKAGLGGLGGFGGFPFGGGCGFGGLGGFGGFPFGGCGFAGLPFGLSGAVHTIKVTETFTTFAGGFSPFNW